MISNICGFCFLLNMSSSIDVINSVSAAIATFDDEILYKNLSLLPIGVIPISQSNKLLALFLNACYENNNTSAVRIIIEFFDCSRIHIDPLPALTQIASNDNIQRDIVIFCFDCFPEKLPLDFYVDLINTDDDLLAIKVAAVFDSIYPQISADDWLTLYHLTKDDGEEEYQNPMLRDFFETKIQEKKIASKPYWVRELPKEHIQSVPKTFPDVKEAVQLLLAHLENNDIPNVPKIPKEFYNTPSFQDKLISQYSISTITEKIEMLSVVKHIDFFDDIPIFREFGPLNTSYLTPDDHICTKNGGCRMFTCNEFEKECLDDDSDIMASDDISDFYGSIKFNYTDSENNIISDTVDTFSSTLPTNHHWFTGSCDLCKKIIEAEHHAVRKPLLYGGWCGCYCVDCLKSAIKNDNEALMVGRMLEQLDVIGIRDRS